MSDGSKSLNERVDALEYAATQSNNYRAYSADGFINESAGLIVITKGSPAELKLKAPDLSMNGNRILVISKSTGGHTVTTLPNVIGGKFSVIDFGGQVGNSVELLASDGVWIPFNSSSVSIY